MSQTIITRDHSAQLAAKLKADLDASNTKLRAAIESTLTNRSSPNAPVITKTVAATPRRARRSASSFRPILLILGCGVALGIGIVVVLYMNFGTSTGPDLADSAVVASPHVGTMRRMNAIRKSFSKQD